VGVVVVEVVVVGLEVVGVGVVLVVAGVLAKLQLVSSNTATMAKNMSEILFIVIKPSSYVAVHNQNRTYFP